MSIGCHVFACVCAATTLSLGLAACGAGSPDKTGSTATASKAAAAQPPPLVVRRSKSFLEELTPQETARAHRIIKSDPQLRPILKDAGHYSLAPGAPVAPNNPHLLIGAGVRIRFQRAISGRYRLPVICYDLKGQSIPLADLNFVWTKVSEIQATVRFDTGKLLFVPYVNGRERLAPGEQPPAVPRSCAEHDRRSQD